MLCETSTTTLTKPIRIVIADDHPFFVDGFYVAMRKHPQVSVAGHAYNGVELLKLVEELLPDVVFTDIQMPVMDGIAATKEIEVIQDVIEVIEQFALLIARFEWKGFVISAVKVRGETAKQLTHRNVYFAIAKVHCRI